MRKSSSYWGKGEAPIHVPVMYNGPFSVDCIMLLIKSVTHFRKDPRLPLESINFRQFVRTLARFKKAPKGGEHEMNTRDKKIECEPMLANNNQLTVKIF